MPRHRERRASARGRRLPEAPADRVPSGQATDDLLLAAGRGDLRALAMFYDRTAPLVFGFLHGALGQSTRTEQATQRVYLHLWCVAPQFDPAEGSAYSLLLSSARRELAGRAGGADPSNVTPNTARDPA